MLKHNLIMEKKFRLLEFLPENTVVWSEDWDFIKEKIEQQEEDLAVLFRIVETESGQAVLHDDEDNYLRKTELSENDFVNAACN